MRLAIVGSRDFATPEMVSLFISLLPLDTVIVTGGARGVDSWAEAAARERGLSTLIIPAQWSRFGKSAGMRRNAEIVKESHAVVAFWDGASHGTRRTMTRAWRDSKPTLIFTPIPPPDFVPALYQLDAQEKLKQLTKLVEQQSYA